MGADARALAGTKKWGSDASCTVDGKAAYSFCCWLGVSWECSSKECHVTKIELVDLNLVGQFDETIANLKKLKILELSYNKISGNLIAALGTLTNLNVLMVDNNELTGSAEFLCDELDLSFFSSDCDDFVEITECSCCFCFTQLGPSESPSVTVPSAGPSVSMVPSSMPSDTPSVTPSESPSIAPSSMPSDAPSVTPSVVPTASSEPSSSPSDCEDAGGESYSCQSNDEGSPYFKVSADCADAAGNSDVCGYNSCFFGVAIPRVVCC